MRNELRRHSWKIRFWKGAQFALWFMLGAQLLFVPAMILQEPSSLNSLLLTDLLVLASAATLGAVVGMITPASPNLVAKVLDAELGLKERLQTAMEVSDKSALSGTIRADALSQLQQADGRKVHTALANKLKWRWPFAASAAGILVLSAAHLASPMLQSSRSPVDTHVSASRGSATTKSADTKGAKSPFVANSVAKILTGEPAYHDTPLASEPPDFESFIRSADRDLKFLEAKATGDGDGSKTSFPAQITTHEPPTGFESAAQPSSDTAERMAALDSALAESAKSGQRGKDDNASVSGADAASSAPNADGGERKDTTDQSPKAPETQSENEAHGPTDKGLAKESEASDEAPGTNSGDEIQEPSRAAKKPIDNDDTQTARYGGGQDPHNAPGAGFPDWMRGDEDPHFMDAGQGEGKSTGKTSGQAGVGHAVPKRGPETEKENVRTAEDLFLPGKRAANGNETSYDTETLAPASASASRVEAHSATVTYENQAEEQMSRNQVPIELRAQVRAYFSEIR